MHEYYVKLLNATATVEKNRKLFNCFYILLFFFFCPCCCRLLYVYVHGLNSQWSHQLATVFVLALTQKNVNRQPLAKLIDRRTRISRSIKHT